MEESRVQGRDRTLVAVNHLDKMIKYAFNYGATERKLANLIAKRNSMLPPEGYRYPDAYSEPHHILDIQPIPWGELRGTIED